jgi:hypothetical protein
MKNCRILPLISRTTGHWAIGIEGAARKFSEELIEMAQHATEERTQNQPSRDAQGHEGQIKGGEASHQNQNTAGGSGAHNQPSHEAQVKGGEHSSQKRQNGSDESADGRTHNQPSHEAQVKGGQHSHSGGSSR